MTKKVIIIFRKIPVVFVGSLLLSIGINGFLVPHYLLDGGTIGIALILHYYFEFPTGVTMIILGLPLCWFAWIYERHYFYNSFYGLIISSLLIDWLEPIKNQFQFSIFSSVILGGIFIGTGVGLMLRYETSTGGTDLLAQLISKAFSLNIGMVILIIDGLIITAGLPLLGPKTFLFSCSTIFIGGLTTWLITKKE
ncbi:YitT family protein [Priestia megaterium]|uniref:YitT family protein n=1 Tax=Priestia TaxID=2800373 RepID=UPI0009B9E71E|nr:YitT family protein [Priestia megaterium]MCF8886862.1 YitT family protein [Priestia megaterium]MDW4511579.1 YitT family protein [Priestia megaterium]MED3863129.1 YitT family protein [Priestia megaterium]MED4101919.1 YitT family protein [Priestia megaterium]MED4142174.1 YitT family protein [Priestia megaterium]